METRRLFRFVVVGIILVSVLTAVMLLNLFAEQGTATDWPMYRYDAARSGVSPEQLTTPLHLQWTYVPKHAPQPAWPEPGRELHRLAFDYAYQVAIANGLVYFGSSADHKVYALDLATGQERWHFFTDSPIRFAPAVEGERVFVASDDGWLYCLSAIDGKLLWRFYGGLRAERLLGNNQMISRWPLRSGVAVENGIVYFTAGMWPQEGVYVYALRAEDGVVIWKNDTSGYIYMGQPHGGEVSMSGVAPQGYVVAYQDKLFVPTGRNVPAAFDRNTGQLLYYQGGAKHNERNLGGSWAFAAAGHIFGWASHWGYPDIDVRLGESEPWPGDGLIAWDYQTGEVKQGSGPFGATQQYFGNNCPPLLDGKIYAAVSGDTLYACGTNDVAAYALEPLLTGANPAACMKWQVPHQGQSIQVGHEGVYALILAGDTVLVGGNNTVTAIAAANGDILWTSAKYDDWGNFVSSPVKGQARGLAVAGGRLVVSTNTGQITCFGPQEVANPPTVSPPVESSPYPDDPLTSAAAAMAKQIISETNITAGYCLLLGAGDGHLAYELAKQSDLRIYCLEPDPQKVAAARQALDSAGFYGVRVTVHQGSPSKLPYPDYFANLIVLGDGIAGDLKNYSAQELYRVLRPCGGSAYVAPGEGASAGWIAQWLQEAGVPSTEINTSDTAVQIVRGELPGAGEWTHQYANARRSGSSEDQLVRLPLKLLWFGKPGPARMISRHWRGPAPLSVNGHLFVAGQRSIIAVDAYNGRELWSWPLAHNVGRIHVETRGANFVADDDSVYVAVGDVCFRVDATTGKTRQMYNAPSAPESLSPESAESLTSWAYLAQKDNLLLGSMGSSVDEGLYVFGLNKNDGQPRWIYTAQGAVSSNAIAVGEDRVYLIDRTSAAKFAKMTRRGEQVPLMPVLVSIDAATGTIMWKTNEGISDRTKLWLSQDVLLATGGPGFTLGMTAYSAHNGEMLWDWGEPRMIGAPVIIGDTIYAEPYAYDLHTGEPKQRSHPLTGEQMPWSFRRSRGCGTMSGTPSALFFRSGTLGFYDLAGDSGVHDFGGVRPGCWTNVIAANGLVLMPPGDAGCTCSYNYQTTVALVPTTRNEQWSVFSSTEDLITSSMAEIVAIGSNTFAGLKPGARIRHVRVNLGVPGDRRDEDGKLWLAFPRPAGVAVPLEIQFSAQGGYYRHNSDELVVQGTNSPWLYASGCRGLRSATLNLFMQRPSDLPEAEPKSYTVRLHFAELENLSPGQRVFDIKLQDEVVLEGLDVVKETGTATTALVKEFRDIQAADTIKLELLPRTDRQPVISAFEIYEE